MFKRIIFYSSKEARAQLEGEVRKHGAAERGRVQAAVGGGAEEARGAGEEREGGGEEEGRNEEKRGRCGNRETENGGRKETVSFDQCDQIGQTFQSLWQQLVCPNPPYS